MIQSVDGKYPAVPISAYVHSGAAVIGDVTLGKHVSVWPGAVVRGDMASVTVGANTNVQDGAILHTGRLKLSIGENVTIGHNAVLHSCDIGSNVLIGIGAVVLDAANIGEYSIIAAGALVPSGKVIPPRSVVMGAPFRIVRTATQEDMDSIEDHYKEYLKLAKTYIRTANIL